MEEQWANRWDQLNLVPPGLRKIFGDTLTKAMGLISDDMIKKYREQVVFSKIESLRRNSKTFCTTYLAFLQRQNEELRTISLAASGNYVEAIPVTSGWPMYEFPNSVTLDVVGSAIGHVDQWIGRYIKEFTEKIVQKGRIAQVEAFVNNLLGDERNLYERPDYMAVAVKERFGGVDKSTKIERKEGEAAKGDVADAVKPGEMETGTIVAGVKFHLGKVDELVAALAGRCK